MKELGARILLNAMRHKAQDDRRRLEELSRLVERTLPAERKRRNATAGREIQKTTDEYDAWFLAECHAEDIYQVEVDFPRLQRYALVVSMMGMVEANVVGFCRAARRIFAIADEFNDLTPRVIARGVQYLERYAGVDTARFRCYVNLAEDLSRVRNCIVHSEGSLKNRTDADMIKAFVKTIPSLVVDDHDRLLPKQGFVENSTHEMHNLLNRLHDALRKNVDTQLGRK